MMGQTSSQIAPSTAQGFASSSTAAPVNTLPRKLKHKQRRSVEQVNKDLNGEESARALLQMRDEAISSVWRPSVEDDLAASSQLMNESYNSQPIISSEQQAPFRKRKRDDKHSERAGKRWKKRRIHNNSSQEDTLYPSEEGSPAPPEAPKALDSLDELFEDPDDETPPESSHKLDDIRSDDGDIASLLQDYEDHDLSLHLLDESHDQAPDEQGNILTSMLPSSLSPPSYPPVSASAQKKRKKKRKRHSALSSDIYAEDGQTSLGVTGQPLFDFDFEAFDELCAANDVGFANLFDDIPGQAVPINSELRKDGDELVHARNITVADSKADASPLSARKGKKRRLSSRSERHEPDHNGAVIPLVSNSSFFDSFDLLNTFQQDQVLPGFEDMQRQSSQEYRPSKASSTESSSHDPSDDMESPEKAYESSKQKASKPKESIAHSDRPLLASSPLVNGEPPRGGAYTSAEITKLEDYREAYCEEHDISTWQFNELVQAPVKGNSTAKFLLQGIYETLPYRKKPSLRRFIHRRFHNFSVRGAWTAEDDEILEQAVAEKGKSWVEVGQMMGRFHEDVRDRWRNYHINKETRSKAFWTDAEIWNLVRAVDECMRLMRRARQKALEEKYEGRDLPTIDLEEEEDDSKLINWQVVSDRMGGTRSRLQCSFKWAHLKDEDRRRFLKEIRAARKGKVDVGNKTPKKSWRVTKAQKKVKQMKAGDKQHLLEALSGCGALLEDNISWQSLGDPEFKSRWSTTDKKVAWAQMKESCPGVIQMHYQDVVNRLMTIHMAEAENLDERYDPNVHGYGSALPPMTKDEKLEHKQKMYKEKLERQKKKRRVKNGGKSYTYKAPEVKSEFFVRDSDEDNGDESTGNMEDQASGTPSTSNSRRSSDDLVSQGRDGLRRTVETADTSIDEYDDEKLPRSRQVSSGSAESLQSLRDV